VDKYADAVLWIAQNDGVGDTPAGMPWDEAMTNVDGAVTVCLVADVFRTDQREVAADVLRKRGFRKPKDKRN